MFKEHSFVVWGKKCTCGNPCCILINNFHPWVENDFVAKLQCSLCGKPVEINREAAAEFYNEKIFSYFDDLEGRVIDLGCGGGFITGHLASNNKVKKLYSVDHDINYKEAIESTGDTQGKIEFVHLDAEKLEDFFNDKRVDYLVSRDVFMFIENTEAFLDQITALVEKGIRQMGWYVKGNDRMKNQLHPDEIAQELKKRGWQVTIEYLDWYKCGYYIKADKGI